MSRRRPVAKRPPPRSLRDRLTTWYAEKRLILSLALRFGGWIVVFFALAQTPLYRHLVEAITCLYASAAAALLNAGGEICYTVGPTLFWYTQSILTVGENCTALEFSWFLTAAILAFPARWKDKAIGISIGVTLLLGLNLVRVTSLYLIGLHAHAYFDLAHDELWSAAFVLTTLFITLAWLGRRPSIPLRATA